MLNGPCEHDAAQVVALGAPHLNSVLGTSQRSIFLCIGLPLLLVMLLLLVLGISTACWVYRSSLLFALTCPHCKSSCCSWCSASQQGTWYLAAELFSRIGFPLLQVKLLLVVLGTSTCLCCKSSCCSWCSAPQRCAGYSSASQWVLSSVH